MIFKLPSFLFFSILALGILPQWACAQQYQKLAPYGEIRWTQEDKPEVLIDDHWYALRSIDELQVDRITEFAVNKYGDRWQKRFSEDLVQVLSEMGHPPAMKVKLVVVSLEKGEETELDDVAMTAENRRSILKSRQKQTSRKPPLAAFKPDDLRRALDDFQAALDDRWSYRHAGEADFDKAIADLRKKIDGGISPDDFGIELQKIIALGIDGHARVSGYRLPCECYLPFLIEREGNRLVAFQPDRTGFLVEGYPYLRKIDGKHVGEWCIAAAVLVPRGSSQYVLQNCLRHLRELDYLRWLMDLPMKETVEIELAAKEGRARYKLHLPVAGQSPRYGAWPRYGSRLLEGNIGYLRLAAMDEEAVKEIKEWMPRFRDTAGLIVDVRDNGGGSRYPLLLLHSFLADPGDPPRVFNAAAYRLHPAHEDDHLAARFMYRVDAEEWSQEERRAVKAFAASFKPEWELPKGQFSDWHYMALNRVDDPDVYQYKMPVVLLMNAKCFSATDIFLAGLKGMKRVTLLGMPSGGGSARSQRVELGGTPLELRIGSMASFQADGKLFDGNGVHPDVVVESVAEYYIGGSDNVREEAVKRIMTR